MLLNISRGKHGGDLYEVVLDNAAVSFGLIASSMHAHHIVHIRVPAGPRRAFLAFADSQPTGLSILNGQVHVGAIWDFLRAVEFKKGTGNVSEDGGSCSLIHTYCLPRFSQANLGVA